MKDLTNAEMEGRELSMVALKALKHSLPGFEKAKLRNFGMTLGVRDTRKIVGRYCLTSDDVRNQASSLAGLASITPAAPGSHTSSTAHYRHGLRMPLVYFPSLLMGKGGQATWSHTVCASFGVLTSCDTKHTGTTF